MIAFETLVQRILSIRGAKIMLDADLAELNGVPTKALNQATRRDTKRFRVDCIIQLAEEEKLELVTSRDDLAKLQD